MTGAWPVPICCPLNHIVPEARQRHLERLLAYSTVAHTGLFLIGLAQLDAAGIGGVALYVLAHAGVKAFLAGVTLLGALIV